MELIILSSFLARAFGNFLSKFDVPYMALPFNLIAVCVFLSLQPLVFSSDSDNVSDNLSDSDSANITLEWDRVGKGIVVSMGQVRLTVMLVELYIYMYINKIPDLYPCGL